MTIDDPAAGEAALGTARENLGARLAARLVAVCVLALGLLALQAPQIGPAGGVAHVASSHGQKALDRPVEARAVLQGAAKADRDTKFPGADPILCPLLARLAGPACVGTLWQISRTAAVHDATSRPKARAPPTIA